MQPWRRAGTSASGMASSSSRPPTPQQHASAHSKQPVKRRHNRHHAIADSGGATLEHAQRRKETVHSHAG